MKKETEEMFEFFKQLWDKQEDEDGYVYCFESGLGLHRNLCRDNSCCYSHILSKADYPEYKFEEWNIKIVHPIEHTQYGANPDKTRRQKAYRDKLIKELGL